jgi:hypothetical protein
MRKARVNGRLVLAAPESPDVALCPACGEPVEKRKRARQDRQVTYFWRHKVGVGDGCPLRYQPVA